MFKTQKLWVIRTENKRFDLTKRFMKKCGWNEKHSGKTIKRYCHNASNQKTYKKPNFQKLTSKRCFYTSEPN